MNMQPVVPPTPAGKKHRTRLYVLCGIHLLLSIVMMFINFIGGLFEIMLVLILYCSASQMHFCQLMMYMIFCMNNFLVVFCGIGLVVQNGEFPDFYTDQSKGFTMTVLIIFAVYYIVAIAISFYAYKEFKAMLYESGQGGGMGGGMVGQLLGARNQAQQQPPQQQNVQMPPGAQPQASSNENNYAINR